MRRHGAPNATLFCASAGVHTNGRETVRNGNCRAGMGAGRVVVEAGGWERVGGRGVTVESHALPTVTGGSTSQAAADTLWLSRRHSSPSGAWGSLDTSKDEGWFCKGNGGQKAAVRFCHREAKRSRETEQSAGPGPSRAPRSRSLPCGKDSPA